LLAIRGDDGDRAVTDAADGGIAPVAAAADEIGELPGRSIKAGQILQQPWWMPGFARSGLSL